MIRAGAALVALVAATGGSCGDLRAGPDVIVVVLGGTRADRCSFAGYARPTTPRLDEFAKGAAVFTDAWSPACWSGPAVASLFTGLSAAHHGFSSGARNRLDDDAPTLAERLHAAGYATGSFSNDATLNPETGLTRGFVQIERLSRDGGRPYPWAPVTHDLAAEWAESVHAAGRPLLLFVHDLEPLLPFTPPSDMATAFLRPDVTPAELREARAIAPPRDVAHDLGVGRLSERELAVMSDLYDAEIATLDREVGSLFDRLRAAGILDSAIVVVTGDHGTNLGEHGFAGSLFSLHRSVCHVPMIVRIPGRFDRGSTVHDVVRLEDVAPTVLEACGVTPGRELDGVSLTRDLAGRVARASFGTYEGTRRRAESLASGACAARLFSPIESAYDGAMHYISRSDGREELYDVVHDPDERDDVIARRPAPLARLRALVTPRR